MKSRVLASLAFCMGSAAAVAGPLPYEAERVPLDVPPAYVLQKQGSGPDLHPGASYWAAGCQFMVRELPDETGAIRRYRVPVCM